MTIKDTLLSLFSKAPSKNNKSESDNVFFVDKTPPE
jgi:hypothetical protein